MSSSHLNADADVADTISSLVPVRRRCLLRGRRNAVMALQSGCGNEAEEVLSRPHHPLCHCSDDPGLDEAPPSSGVLLSWTLGIHDAGAEM